MTPWFNRIGVENARDGAGTDRLAQGGFGSSGEVSGRQPAQWQLGLADGFAGDRFDDRLVAKVKKRAFSRPSCPTNEKSPHAQRCRQRRTELGYKLTRGPAA